MDNNKLGTLYFHVIVFHITIRSFLHAEED